MHVRRDLGMIVVRSEGLAILSQCVDEFAQMHFHDQPQVCGAVDLIVQTPSVGFSTNESEAAP